MVNANQMQMLMFAKEQPLKTVSKDKHDNLADNGFKKVLDSKVESYSKPLKVNNSEEAKVTKHEVEKVNKKVESNIQKDEKTDLKDSNFIEDAIEPDEDTKKNVSVKETDKDQPLASKREKEQEQEQELGLELLGVLQQILSIDTKPELVQEELKNLAEKLGINVDEIKQIQESISSFMQKAVITLPKMEEILKQLVEKTVQGETQDQASKDLPVNVELNQNELDIKEAFQQMQKQVAEIVEKIQQKIETQQTLVKEEPQGTLQQTKPEASITAQTVKPIIKEEIKQNSQQPEKVEFDEQELETEIPIVKSKTSDESKLDLNGQKSGNKEQTEFLDVSIQAKHQQNQNPQISEVKQSFAMPSQTMSKDIMEQVVDKAQVIVDENKSEMIMDLKPESLGKLSLKIVHERGQIMARFVAESEQVKAILESNMQLLKDSLEKQGLSVQGFSVSVNQDSNQQQHSEDFRNQTRKSVKGTPPKVASESIMGIYDKSISNRGLSGYLFEGQPSINLTA